MSFTKGVVVKSVAPTATDDVTKGFYRGFRWVFADAMYDCCDATMGEAVWSSGASNELTPEALTGDVDNYSPTGWNSRMSHLRIDCGGSHRKMTGINSAGFKGGQRITIINTSNKVLEIIENDGDSDGVNRFLFKGKLNQNESKMFIYDATFLRWAPTH